jgi:hypothetical protein
MVEIYNITSVLIILLTIIYLNNYDEILDVNNWYKKFIKLNNELPIKSDYRKSHDYYYIFYNSIYKLIDSTFIVVGLLSDIFITFSIIFAIDFIIGYLNMNFFVYKKLNLIFTIAKLILYAYLLMHINHY